MYIEVLILTYFCKHPDRILELNKLLLTMKTERRHFQGEDDLEQAKGKFFLLTSILACWHYLSLVFHLCLTPQQASTVFLHRIPVPTLNNLHLVM